MKFKENELKDLFRGLIMLRQIYGDPPPDEELQTKLKELLKSNVDNPLGEGAKLLELELTHKYIKPVDLTYKRIVKLKTPFLARAVSGRWFALGGTDGQVIAIQYLNKNTPDKIDFNTLFELGVSELIIVVSKRRKTGESRHFSLKWFFPAFWRLRVYLGEMLAISLLIQVVALASPLFFQVVIDKVISSGQINTLHVIAWVLISLSVFEVFMSIVREYLVSHSMRRVDLELGGKLFRHILSLPMAYFQNTQTGVTSMRAQQLNDVRDFLTNSSITLGVDCVFSLVFFVVMYHFSPFLTAIVGIGVPLLFIISGFIAKPLRRGVEAMAEKTSINNAFLTETVSSVETIKSLALEPQKQSRWERQMASFASTNFSLERTQRLGEELIQLTQKLIMTFVVGFGAFEVFNNNLTVGQFIAFTMFTNHVLQPLTRTAQLLQNYQQASVAIERLGALLNVPLEYSAGAIAFPGTPRGEINFENVVFRYNPDAEPALKDISLKIKAGQNIGIVGASGSGKSTFTNLLLMFYEPEQGRVLVDGHNLRDIEPESLRKHIGVVFQESFLFNNSVRDNIAYRKPAIKLDEIVRVSKLSGAHDFIVDLAEGYDTMVAENGSSLSGGQRQRIALARALLDNPRILILDEATSALDDISQNLIQKNMADICAERTVISIAHRLSTVRNCDLIFVMDQGQLIEFGTHDELVRKGNYYARLIHLQKDLQDV